MSLNFTDVVKQGPTKMRRRRNTTMPFWKSRYIILRKSSSKGPLRMECFRSEKMSQLTESVLSVYDLRNVRSITFLPSTVRRNALAILFNDETFVHVAFENEAETMSWQVALQSICLPSTRPLTAPMGMDLLSFASESSNQDVFNVYLLPTPSLSISGECLLQCTTETLYLLDVEDPKKRLVGWPLNALRRYGRDNTKFTFESGRSCPTGEGIFIFNTIHGEEIYLKVHNASIAISEAYRFNDRKQDFLPPPPRRQLTRTETVPIPPRHSTVDGVALALPPRQSSSVRRHSTVDRRRPLPPPPPPIHQ